VGCASIAIGSKLGTVYLYPLPTFSEPIENNNLVTHITKLSTSRGGEYCLALSKWKANAVRLLDPLTGRAIGNWPAIKTKTGLPLQAAFNPAGQFGVGESKGFVSIYGFEHNE
jgi:hypothetical protein